MFYVILHPFYKVLKTTLSYPFYFRKYFKFLRGQFRFPALLILILHKKVFFITIVQRIEVYFQKKFTHI